MVEHGIQWWLEAGAYTRLAVVAPLCLLSLWIFAWILFKRIPGKRPPKEFVEWCRRETPLPRSVFDVQTFDKQRGAPRGDWGDKEEKQFFEEVNKKLHAKENFSVHINRVLGAAAHKIVGTGSDCQGRLANLEISQRVSGPVTIEAVSIKALLLRAGPIRLDIKNCTIACLYVNRQSFAKLTIQDSDIGTLKLDGGQCLAHYDMRGGCILNVECEPPGPVNPFTGPVSLRQVFLPRDSKSYLLEGPQPYRNLRAHLRSLENI